MPRIVVTCPGCSQKLRVPDDRGSIYVTCGSCSLEWLWESSANLQTSVEAGEPSGILSWFSKTAQGLTGTSADVYVQPLAEWVRPGEMFDLQIDVHVSEFELSAKEVTVELVGEEIVVLPWWAIRRSVGAEFDLARDALDLLVNRGKFSHQETIFEAEYQVMGEIHWEANAKGELQVHLQLPSDALPSMEGQTIACQWRARAIVSTSGVSPKSEWVPIQVIGHGPT